MSIKTHKSEQIATFLRQTEVRIAVQRTTSHVCQQVMSKQEGELTNIFVADED